MRQCYLGDAFYSFEGVVEVFVSVFDSVFDSVLVSDFVSPDPVFSAASPLAVVAVPVDDDPDLA